MADAQRLPGVRVKPPFEALVSQHGATVLRVCRAVVGPDDADDAWSETFLSALRAYPELPDDANVEAWLVTIAHRRAIDVIRARGRRAIPVEDIDARADAPVSASLGTDIDLMRALASLPDKQRQAVAYHHLVGLPHGEVAVILGGSADAARRASSDGIQALRVLLSTTEGDPR